MQLLGVLASGATPTSDEQADGLIALNAMVEAWRNDRLMAYALQEESLTLTASSTSRTIGPTGNLVTTRPVAIEGAWILESSVTYKVRMLSTREEYSSIPDKTTTSDWPEVAYYEAAMSDGTLYYYPSPNASRTMKLLTRVPVTSFAATSTTVTLPPGWEDALAFNLAVRFAPALQVPASPEVRAIAIDTLAGIKRANMRTLKVDSGLMGVIGRPPRSNILIG